MQMGSPKNILVIKLGALGDFIQAMGAMAAIRKHHKEDKITLLTTAPFEKFAKDCGYFDEIIIDQRPKWYQIGGWLSLRAGLIAGQYARIYDLQNNDRTSLYFSLLPRKEKPEWVGVAKGASHRNISPERTAGHAFDGHKQTLGFAGLSDVKIDTLDWMKADLSIFSLEPPYIVLVPGSAPDRPEKRWPADQYGHLANQITDLGYQAVILGTAAEKDATDKIAEICPQALNLGGKTSLYQIAALGRGAAAAIGNDTGPMHLIGATNCPCLVLFSRHSNPLRHAPKGDFVHVLCAEDLSDLKSEEVLKALSPRFDKPESRKTRG